jgi:lysophospholipase L1-like esterase
LVSAAVDFEACYRRLLDRVKKETSARLLILEPFLLPTPPDRIAWREDLDPRIAAVRRVACDYAALYLPLDGIFAAAATQRPANFWTADGVHPTQAGHALIAQHWLRAVGVE